MPKAAADIIRRLGATGADQFRSFSTFIYSTLAQSHQNELSTVIGAACILLLRGKTVEDIRGPAGSPPVFLNGKPLVWG